MTPVTGMGRWCTRCFKRPAQKHCPLCVSCERLLAAFGGKP